LSIGVKRSLALPVAFDVDELALASYLSKRPFATV
jgi:hypothetical protein